MKKKLLLVFCFGIIFVSMGIQSSARNYNPNSYSYAKKLETRIQKEGEHLRKKYLKILKKLQKEKRFESLYTFIDNIIAQLEIKSLDGWLGALELEMKVFAYEKGNNVDRAIKQYNSTVWRLEKQIEERGSKYTDGPDYIRNFYLNALDRYQDKPEYSDMPEYFELMKKELQRDGISTNGKMLFDDGKFDLQKDMENLLENKENDETDTKNLTQTEIRELNKGKRVAFGYDKNGNIIDIETYNHLKYRDVFDKKIYFVIQNKDSQYAKYYGGGFGGCTITEKDCREKRKNINDYYLDNYKKIDTVLKSKYYFSAGFYLKLPPNDCYGDKNMPQGGDLLADSTLMTCKDPNQVLGDKEFSITMYGGPNILQKNKDIEPYLENCDWKIGGSVRGIYMRICEIPEKTDIEYKTAFKISTARLKPYWPSKGEYFYLLTSLPVKEAYTMINMMSPNYM